MSAEKRYKQRVELVEAYDRLDSVHKMEEEFEASSATIYRWMKRHDIDMNRTQKKTIHCDHCGEEIERIPSHIEGRDNHFCDYDCHYGWMSENQVEENNPNWEPMLSMECEWCEKEFEFESKYEEERRFCSRDCANEWKSEAFQGENHHNWTGGSHYFYYGSNWRKQRLTVKERDEVCQICNHDGSERTLDVHHITPLRTFDTPENANTLDNLILLCRSCHGDVESGRVECPVVGGEE